MYTHIHIITCTHIISYTLPFDVTFYLTCLFPGSCGFAFADSSPRSFGTGKGASSDVYLVPGTPMSSILSWAPQKHVCMSICTQLIFKSMICICLLLSVAVPHPQYNIRVPTNTIYLGGPQNLQNHNPNYQWPSARSPLMYSIRYVYIYIRVCIVYRVVS